METTPTSNSIHCQVLYNTLKLERLTPAVVELEAVVTAVGVDGEEPAENG